MVGEQIEQMKRDYTDKYVVVDGTRPELARFRDVVGRVKTVNMSGRRWSSSTTTTSTSAGTISHPST